MPRMPKITKVAEPVWLYKRPGSETIYTRDRLGHYNSYIIQGNTVRLLPGGITALGPIYGRVNFSNNVRFTGRTRSQRELKRTFKAAHNNLKLTTGWVPLPKERAASRRQTNQGMNNAMSQLTGQQYSASQYAGWYTANNAAAGINVTVPWEWCHLLAHSMGGADDETNIVAAVKGNNSEQLAIESALQMYRREQFFEMKITAVSVDGGQGIHLGDLIEYKIRCQGGGDNFLVYLDCLHAPNPSQIHYYGLLKSVAIWANEKLVARSQISWREKRLENFIKRNIKARYQFL